MDVEQALRRLLSGIAQRLQASLEDQGASYLTCHLVESSDGDVQIVLRREDTKEPLLTFESIVLTMSELRAVLSFIKASSVEIVEGGEAVGD